MSHLLLSVPQAFFKVAVKTSCLSEAFSGGAVWDCDE